MNNLCVHLLIFLFTASIYISRIDGSPKYTRKYAEKPQSPDVLDWFECYYGIQNRYMSTTRRRMTREDLVRMVNFEGTEFASTKVYNARRSRVVWKNYQQFCVDIVERIGLLSKKSTMAKNLLRIADTTRIGCLSYDFDKLRRVQELFRDISYVNQDLLPDFLSLHSELCAKKFKELFENRTELIPATDQFKFKHIEEGLRDLLKNQNLYAMNPTFLPIIFNRLFQMIHNMSDPTIKNINDLGLRSYREYMRRSYEIMVYTPASRMCNLKYSISKEFMLFRNVFNEIVQPYGKLYGILNYLNGESGRIYLACMITHLNYTKLIENQSSVWLRYLSEDTLV